MKKTLLIVVTIWAMAACQSMDKQSYTGIESVQEAAESVEEVSEESLLALNDEGNYKNKQKTSANSNTTTPTTSKPKKSDKKIIKTADIRAEVEDLKAARANLNKLIKKHGAYTFSENTENSYYEISTKLTIRMTPEHFEAFIKDLDGVSQSMDYKRINARDVTAQFVDLSARLSTKRDALNRYREILKKANTVKEILEVEDKMRQIVEEIEAAEGRLKYLSDQVGYSTINLEIYEKSDRPIAKQKSFFSKVGDAFGDGWSGLLSLVVGLISIWPFLIIIGGLIYWFLKVWRRRTDKV